MPIETSGRERLIERYMPIFDVRERHETTIRAPADIVFETACEVDMQGHPLIRAIIRARAAILRSGPEPARTSRKLVEESLAMGWAMLDTRPGRELIMGAAARPWMGDPHFESIPPGQFLAYAAPDRVKIVWTLEVDPLLDGLTRFRTETRAVATDPDARTKFRRYWRKFGVGIRVIRWIIVPQVRAESEHRRSSSPRADP